MDTRISSRVINTIDSTTEHSLYVSRYIRALMHSKFGLNPNTQFHFVISQVDAANPAFPRPTAHWWYGCQNVASTFNNLGMIQASEHIDHDSDADVGDLVFDAGEWNRPEAIL